MQFGVHHFDYERMKERCNCCIWIISTYESHSLAHLRMPFASLIIFLRFPYLLFLFMGVFATFNAIEFMTDIGKSRVMNGYVTKIIFHSQILIEWREGETSSSTFSHKWGLNNDFFCCDLLLRFHQNKLQTEEIVCGNQ